MNLNRAVVVSHMECPGRAERRRRFRARLIVPLQSGFALRLPRHSIKSHANRRFSGSMREFLIRGNPSPALCSIKTWRCAIHAGCARPDVGRNPHGPSWWGSSRGMVWAERQRPRTGALRTLSHTPADPFATGWFVIICAFYFLKGRRRRGRTFSHDPKPQVIKGLRRQFFGRLREPRASINSTL